MWRIIKQCWIVLENSRMISSLKEIVLYPIVLIPVIISCGWSRGHLLLLELLQDNVLRTIYSKNTARS